MIRRPGPLGDRPQEGKHSFNPTFWMGGSLQDCLLSAQETITPRPPGVVGVNGPVSRVAMAVVEWRWRNAVVAVMSWFVKRPSIDQLVRAVVGWVVSECRTGGNTRTLIRRTPVIVFPGCDERA